MGGVVGAEEDVGIAPAGGVAGDFDEGELVLAGRVGWAAVVDEGGFAFLGEQAFSAPVDVVEADLGWELVGHGGAGVEDLLEGRAGGDVAGEEAGKAGFEGDFHSFQLAGDDGGAVEVLVVEEDVVGLEAALEVGDGLVGAGLVVVVGDGLAAPEGEHVAPGLAGEAGAAEGGAEVLALVAGNWRGAGLHAGPDNDGEETLGVVVALVLGVAVGADGAPCGVAHGADGGDAAFESGEAAGTDRVEGVGLADSGDDGVVVGFVRTVLGDLFAGRNGGAAEVDVGIETGEGYVGAFGKEDVGCAVGAEVDLERMAWVAGYDGGNDFPVVEVELAGGDAESGGGHAGKFLQAVPWGERKVG